MSTYKTFSTLETSQRDRIPGEAGQVTNNEGGYVYTLDDFKYLERFLILGSEGGSYYTDDRTLTKANAINTLKCIEADGLRAVQMIVGISESGRAVKNDPAIFVLALCAAAKDVQVRTAALAALPRVCRIPTHLFHFVTYVRQMRGMGRGLKRALASWYNDKDVQGLAYQMVKYQSRDGFSNADVLRLSHPATADEARHYLYKWAVDGLAEADKKYSSSFCPPILTAHEAIKGTSTTEACALIRRYNLSREMLPTELLQNVDVWASLLEKMPYTAMIRNLATMTRVGLLKPLSDSARTIGERLRDRDALKKARVHPASVLIAQKVYQSGRPIKGTGIWSPVPSILDALNDAFYLSFDYLEPTSRNIFVGVDVSGSMNTRMVAGIPLSAAEGAAAMALSVAKTEPNYYIAGFTGDTEKGNYWRNRQSHLTDLNITPGMRVSDVMNITKPLAFGPTDCALPMLHALREGLKVDCFVIITDNETWHGDIHPKQALEKYRRKTGIAAKLVVLGMTATQFTIADPSDPLSLDVAGFDSSVPAAIQEFIR